MSSMLDASPHKAIARVLKDDGLLVCALAFANLRRDLFTTLERAETGAPMPDSLNRANVECVRAWRVPGSKTETHRGYLTATFNVNRYMVRIGFPHDESGVLVGVEFSSQAGEKTVVDISDIERIGFSWAAKNPLFWRSLALLRERGESP